METASSITKPSTSSMSKVGSFVSGVSTALLWLVVLAACVWIVDVSRVRPK